jgi:hypothetical protein
MKNMRLFFVVAMSMFGCVYSMNEQKKEIMDIRKRWLEFPHNKQDENGNTFWHQLAIESKTAQDWMEMELKMAVFKQRHNYWLPNPLIENNEGRTAKKEAKKIFSQSGNPVCALLVMYLNQNEYNFVNKVAVKSSRFLMDLGQYYEHPNKDEHTPRQLLKSKKNEMKKEDYNALRAMLYQLEEKK